MNGDADRLTIASAPARDELLDRIVVIAPALPEIAVVPDVLADADAEPPPAELEHLRTVKRLEVAVLVEHVVGRQQRLAETLRDRAVVHEHGAVEERPSLVRRVRLGETDERRRQIARIACQLLEHLPAAAHESVAEQQIARQVSDERQFGRHGQVGALRARVAERVEDEPRVAGEIADRRVDLEQRDLHDASSVDPTP